jgi:hypothetical protein
MLDFRSNHQCNESKSAEYEITSQIFWNRVKKEVLLTTAGLHIHRLNFVVDAVVVVGLGILTLIAKPS